MSQKFANAARSRLAAGINASVTTFTVELSTADLFPIANTPDWLSKNDWFKATIQNALGQFEIIYVGVRASGSGVFSNVLRGQEGTTASAWNAGDVVGLRLTALDHESLVNIKTVDNTFEGSNTFDQPIIGDLQGNADTASLAAVATLANAVVDAAVSTPKIVDSAVTTPKINDSAVTTPKISDGAVNLAKQAPEVIDRLVPAGSVGYFARRSAPNGWLKANGAAVSRSTYSALYAALCPVLGNFTASIASPGVLTLAGNDLRVGERVRLSTTGSLPTGLVVNTDYFVQSKPGADTFTLSATLGGAAINTSGAQSGVHTIQSFAYGAGDGSTTFNLPDLRGEFIRGLDDSRGVDAGRGLGVAQLDALQGHMHAIGKTEPLSYSTANAISQNAWSQANSAFTASTSLGWNANDGIGGMPRWAAETRPRNQALLACIKF